MLIIGDCSDKLTVANWVCVVPSTIKKLVLTLVVAVTVSNTGSVGIGSPNELMVLPTILILLPAIKLS